MSKLFSLSDIANTGTDKTPNTNDGSACRQIEFERMHTLKIENIKNLIGKLPAPGEAFFLWTFKSFNAFTFILYIIKHRGAIDHLIFTTYSFSERVLTTMMRYYDAGQIKKIDIYLSELIKIRSTRVNDLLQAQIGIRSISVKYGLNHSKIALIHIADDYFVLEGSGNFSENALNEQYLFTNNKELYDFRYKCIYG